MSLLLLLAGAEPAAGGGDDRTFTATWEQAVAGWEAVAIQLNADGSFAQNQSWSATATVPVDQEDGFPRPAIPYGPQFIFQAGFTQAPARWRAKVDENDDEITLTELGVL